MFSKAGVSTRKILMSNVKVITFLCSFGVFSAETHGRIQFSGFRKPGIEETAKLVKCANCSTRT